MEIDIRTLLSKLNPECKRAMVEAAELCVKQTQFNVELEHLLVRLIESGAPDLKLVLERFEVNANTVTTQLQHSMDGFKRGNGRTPALSPHFMPLFQEAWLLSSMLLGSQQIRSGTVILAMLEVDSLRGLLIETAPDLLRIPRGQLRAELPTLLARSAEDAGESGHIAPGANANANTVPNGTEGTLSASGPGRMPELTSGRNGHSATPSLDQFTVDMTALAREGRIDPIRGRDEEIRQIIDILLRRRQNNPILTGEAGVGKTAVVEGFAQRVAQGAVPPALANVSVRTLDLGLLQAGAGIKGEFENRLKSVIAEVRASATPIILFIDEAHQLIGAGGAEGQGDAANLLKPALARGELRTIAATTWAEYKKYVERDPALARRFQVVKVEEPVQEVAVGMLRGMVATLEKHHGVEILDEAVLDAVRLSDRYITGRQLPDKAISVLDTACARVAIGQSGSPSQLESLDREIMLISEELRIMQQQHARGEDRAEEISRSEKQLKSSRERQSRLSEKLSDERCAVREILSLRQKIADSVNNGEEADEDVRASRAAQLQRLQKGLEAIQDDEPLVPVCVDSNIVADVISGWTGIPVGKMLADEIHTVLHLKDRLGERVVGQDQALDAIARRVRTFRAELDDPGKPVGVFMLVGPSGVGKTETAFALADMLYGGERNMVTINMSEFQEAHSVSSLKGAPPGYVGYGKGGVLTEAVRRRPYSVVLLDEMEKAHPDVLEMFFQVFDKGTMEDGEGISIDFKNTLILLTSNAAQDVITQACESGRRPDVTELTERLRPVLLRQFSPAFLGRVVLVPYYPLGDEQIRNIVDLKLEKLAQRFAENHNAKFTWDDQVTELVTARCTEVDSGARNIDFILTQTVLPQLSSLVLERMSMLQPFTAIHMHVSPDNQFAFDFQDSVLGTQFGSHA
ncbi:type VI secretion system ATPase TssH [Noviherbaspirillum sp. Root189]|uniref:type VI secretion system ATPase TssH n=1 Tax=Noviherbaspirillum sp. Root189 TaxID=1736487 RepID=UPI00070AAA9C|nr:type VI secretion system ATPase TssH [Noviherbaspirillum sp. Root189]KRB67888.1 ClpV1 family T6SS ATPase [Noviherbaspirillum sp. Root189]